jgi:hypothetical protein
MLAYAAVAALAGWAGVLAGAKAAAHRAARPRPPRAFRDEPPAVVAQLASRRLDGNAFAATVLDLADRGWLALHEADDGLLYCQVLATAPDERLARHEAMVVEHAAVRADQAGQVPVVALADDFRPVTQIRAAKTDWRLFCEQVREEAVRRRLVRRVPGGRPLGAMWALATVPAALGAAVLGQAFGPGAAAATLFGGYLILGVTAGRVLPVERVLPAGRAALAEWAGSAQAGSAQAGSAQAGWAVALGRSPDVAARFAPAGDLPWSSVGGWWHQVGLGLPAAAGRPRGTMGIDGQVVSRWIDVTATSDGHICEYFAAIDDGSSEFARAVLCDRALYIEARPGRTVHAQVDLPRNALTALTARRPVSG